MPSSRSDRIRFTILCEDKSHYYFCKAYLEKALGKRRVACYRSQIPAGTGTGTGSGEQWVRETYPKERRALQQRTATEKHWLVVVMNGDLHTQEDRKKLLPTEQRDKIIRIIPSRNIETWFEWLDNADVDELTDYKKQHRDAKPSRYGQRMQEQCEQTTPDRQLPSKQQACGEWQCFKDRIA